MSLIMKPTTNTGKVQKFRGKEREENIEAIYIITFSLKRFTLIH